MTRKNGLKFGLIHNFMVVSKLIKPAVLYIFLNYSKENTYILLILGQPVYLNMYTSWYISSFDFFRHLREFWSEKNHCFQFSVFVRLKTLHSSTHSNSWKINRASESYASMFVVYIVPYVYVLVHSIFCISALLKATLKHWTASKNSVILNKMVCMYLPTNRLM